MSDLVSYRKKVQRWYNNRRWVRRSRQQLTEHPLCVMCLQDGIVTAARVADHVRPHRGNAYEFWHGPLCSLCFQHHNASKKEIETKGFVTDIGSDGWPVDPKHPANKVG